MGTVNMGSPRAYIATKESREEKRSCDMANSSDRAGLPETETGTPQRSCHRFEDGRQDASVRSTRRP